jgi:hypothetical protein
VRTRGSKPRSKTSLQNRHKLENLLGNIEIFPARNLIFLARNLIFLNGFPTFVNGFLLSSITSQFSSTAYHFPRNPRKSIYGGKYPKDCYSSFVFPATCSPSFVIPATMSTSPPTLMLFDGASNVQNARELVSITYPCITVVHGAEHVVSLFFKDIFTKMPVFQCLSQFLKWCRHIFGSTRHGPHAIFKKHSIMHNTCIYIGFIKISECHMAGELIGLLRLLRLRDILRVTIASKEFKDI